MADTFFNQLPLIASNQAQKHVTHNEALVKVDAIIQLAVISQTLTAPPGSPVEGDRYIIASGATGAWLGKDLNIAVWSSGAWAFYAPRAGWVCYVAATANLWAYNGSGWAVVAGGGGGGGVTDGDKGDIIVSGSGSVWTIDWISILDSNFRLQDNADTSKVLMFQLSGLTPATTRTLTVPDASGTLALLGTNQTFTGNMTFTGTFAVSAASATLGNSTGASTQNVGTGVTTSGNTKTLNLGTAGVSGSTTVVNVGSAVAGALGSMVINTPTVTFAASVTAIGAAAANISALRLGLGGATADATNQLSVNTPSVLFNRGTDTINVTLNKQAAANDARFTFQTAFSTRALFGTLANDDFTLSVSPDGTTLNNAFTALAASGDITGLDVRANSFQIRDNTDRTKIGVFDVSGLTTGTTRTYTLPDNTGIILTDTGAQTIGGSKTFTAPTGQFGGGTGASTISIASGATLAATTKTLNLGTGGVSTSVTNVNIGSATAGALGTLTINTPNVVFSTVNTSITINGTTSLTGTATTAALLYLGLGGATADATNRLSINTPAVLLNNAGTSIDMTFNKNAVGNDATLSFKTGFSVRGIVGLQGDDDLTLKVSPDGSTFYTGMLIKASDGRPEFHQPLILQELTSKPAAPASGKAAIYARERADQSWIDVQRASGRDFPLQPHMGVNRVAFWAPSTTTTVTAVGMPVTNVGTVSHPTPASTSLKTSMRRWSLTSAAAINSVSDQRSAVNACWRGNAAGLGGFTYTNRLALTTLQATGMGFFGLYGSTAALATTLLLSGVVSCVGIGFQRGTHTNWQLVQNDAAGAPTLTNLGASFPVNTTDVITLYIGAVPNGSSIGVRVVNETTGDSYDATLTTDIPAATVFLSPRNYLNNGTTAAAVAFDCAGVYLESDF